MVSLSLTRSRIAEVLTAAADSYTDQSWDPYLNPLLTAIDRAAGYTPGSGTPDVEAATLAAWDALTAHLYMWPGNWERQPGRTQAEVVDALRASAAQVAT